MKIHQSVMGTALAIATIVSCQSASLATNPYKSRTQPFQNPILTASALTAQTPEVVQGGSAFFSHPPRLVRAAASQTGGYTPSTYEFTLTIPEDAGQPLKSVIIAQVKNLETIHFDTSQSRAFAGKRFGSGPELSLTSVGGAEPTNPNEVLVVFDKPVQPGKTVTVAIHANLNPSWDGVYLFGVTAYPNGENGRGQFLGYGRIHFYGNSD